MTGDGERRLRIGIFAEGKPQKLTGRSKRIRLAAFLLAFLCAWFAQILASSNNPAISPAFAAGKGKANGNGNGNGAGNGSGNGNAGGNGNGNANGNGNGRANSHSNDITDGNGIGIDLGDGVGVSIGVGNGDTIGVGIGISLGDSGGGHGNQPLEKNVHKDPPRSHGPGVDRWPPGHGADKRKNDGEGDFDLGEHFDAGRIGKAFGDNVDELGKLLGPADVSVRDIGADRENAVGNDDAPAHGEADHSANAAKAKDNVNLNGAGNGNGNGNGKALGLTKEHGSGNGNGNGKALGLTKGHGNGKALAKGQNQDPEEALAAESAAAAKAGRENSGQGGATTISPGSYVEREVLALGLSPQGISRVRQLGFGMGETGLEQDEKTLVTLYVPARLDALSAISLLRRELPRESLHLNRIYRPYDTATKDDLGKTPPNEHGADGRCCGDKSYGKAAIGWKDKFADCARDINVGVIDTDVDLQHPAFLGQKITRRAFLADGKRSSPNAHGTSVLALLAGRPDSDTPGLIPEARFFLANVFFDAGNGETITDTVSLLKSLEWMNASQTKVVNMSFAGPQDDLLQVRFKALRAHGVVFTAAAGNEGPAAFPVYPAAYPEVIAVTAITKDRHIYPSANRGPYIDVAAPGVRIWTALPDAREGYRTGTSFATPFVTAVLALQQPDLMYEPKDELLDHLNPVRLGAEQRDPIYGRGLLQAPGECSGGSRPASDWAPLASSIAR